MMATSDHPYMQEQAWRDAKAFLPDIVVIKLGTNDSKSFQWNQQQYERDYQAMLDTLKRWCPISHDAFMEYRMGGAHLSRTGLAIVKRLLAGEAVDQKSSGMSAREWRELMAALGRS